MLRILYQIEIHTAFDWFIIDYPAMARNSTTHLLHYCMFTKCGERLDFLTPLERVNSESFRAVFINFLKTNVNYCLLSFVVGQLPWW